MQYASDSNNALKDDQVQQREKKPTRKRRFDLRGHYPQIDNNDKGTRCKYEKCPAQGKTRAHIFCAKCKVHLCLIRKRNCFNDFHTIQPTSTPPATQ